MRFVSCQQKIEELMLGHSLVVDFCHITLAACLTVSQIESPAQVTKMTTVVMMVITGGRIGVGCSRASLTEVQRAGKPLQSWNHFHFSFLCFNIVKCFVRH